MDAEIPRGELSGMGIRVPDCWFKILPANKRELTQIVPDFDSVFRAVNVCSVERLYPEWFFGFDFKPPKEVPHNPCLLRPPYQSPKGDLRPGGGIEEPLGFVEFVNRYRQNRKKRFAVDNRDVSVHVVFLDADNDGDVDFYISSDLDMAVDGQFTWELHVAQGASTVKVENTVYPVPLRKELCALQPVVRASKDSFCRVVRLDVAPVFLVIDKTKKNQVRSVVRDINVHRVEKLSSRTYFEAE